MRRRKRAPEHVNHERWLVSYADFITLLFAFFTTLYAISTVDAQKMGKMVQSMRASFDSTVFEAGSSTLGLSKGEGSGKEGGKDLVVGASVSRGGIQRDHALGQLRAGLSPGPGVLPGSALGALKRSIEARVGPDALRKATVRTRLDRRGLVISLGEGGFFDSGSDQLKPEGRKLLDTIATGLTSVRNHVRIEGHTDNVPIRNSRFPSNWDLSTARATAIVAYLVTQFGLSPDNLSAAGYAEYRPVATNDTEEGRSRNRRVDLVVLDPRYAEVEPR